jgi:hypothetical protein
MRLGGVLAFKMGLMWFCILHGVLPCQCVSGLHAGIQAQVLALQNGYTDEPRVLLSFVLLNDTNASLSVHEDSWKIVVNGTEVEDSGGIFGNGPHPIGGYGNLKPGESYQLAKALSISEYFSTPGAYKVAWKGRGFETPTITVLVPALPPKSRN